MIYQTQSKTSILSKLNQYHALEVINLNLFNMSNKSLSQMKSSIILPFTFFILTLTSLVAQNRDAPWHVGLSFNVVDVYPTGAKGNEPFAPQGKMFEDFFNVSDHWNFGGPTLYISRSIINGFSVGARVSLNLIKKIEGDENANYKYFAAGGFFKQTFFLPKRINPFLTIGYGISDIVYDDNKKLNLLSSKTFMNITGGFGFDVKITDFAGLSFETLYLSPLEDTGVKHFRHQLGFYYSFDGRDSDRDGIKDKNDNCPDVPGLKEFNGCPDSDGDQIPDHVDNCPEEFGTEIMNGCPDRDGDGIADKDDECPDTEGLADLKGCPDADGDGIADKDDICPLEAGLAENSGCPLKDSDGDGINDTVDACPEQAGTIENNGCPELSNEVVQTLNQLATQINFMAGSDRIIGRAIFDALEEIKNLLVKNPEGNLVIEGHTSSDGKAEGNLILSQKRAHAVKIFLIEKGVNPDRLRTEGFGEERPLFDNQTFEGRAKNRRVQFSVDFN